MKFKEVFFSTIVFLLLAATSSFSYADGVQELYGTWTVDYEQTLEKAKENPKYSADEMDEMPQIIKKMVETMKVRLTPSNMIFFKNDKEKSYPFMLVAESKNTARIEYNTGEKQFFLDFTLIDKEHMSFKSSASDDMDSYVWKKMNSGV